MNNHDVLLQLAERCETEEPSRALDAAIQNRILGGSASDLAHVLKDIESTARPLRYTSSLDAAVTLVPKRWFWRCGYTPIFNGWAHVSRTHADHCDRKDEHSSTKARNPRLALCAAALKARAALAEQATRSPEDGQEA